MSALIFLWIGIGLWVVMTYYYTKETKQSVSQAETPNTLSPASTEILASLNCRLADRDRSERQLVECYRIAKGDVEQFFPSDYSDLQTRRGASGAVSQVMALRTAYNKTLIKQVVKDMDQL